MSTDYTATLPLRDVSTTAGPGGWRAEREQLESERAAQRRPRGRALADSRWFEACLAQFGRVLRCTPLWERGLRNAADLRLRRIELRSRDLPRSFDGYRILHLTDLHVDAYPETTAAAAALAGGVEADVCVLTGDYRASHAGPFRQILPAMRELVAAAQTPDGVYGVLGNHDCAAMVEAFEPLGLRMLVNESISLRRGGDRISLTGLDDVHAFYTERARRALETSPRGFRIALVHSPEIADVAAREGFHLYLAGHTHGGQICLPGARPVFTCLRRFRGYAAGEWRHGAMAGYTSTGTGVSGLPIRFNSRGEVALITLRAA